MDFTKIEEVFDVAEKISNTDIQSYKDGVLQEVINKPDEELEVEELTAKHMFESFQQAHGVFKSSLELSTKVLNKLHENLLLYEEEISPEMIAAFASLQKNMMESVKVITASYKQMSETKVNLEGKNKSSTGTTGTTHIENANIVVGSTTRELLSSLKQNSTRA